MSVTDPTNESFDAWRGGDDGPRVPFDETPRGDVDDLRSHSDEKEMYDPGGADAEPTGETEQPPSTPDPSTPERPEPGGPDPDAPDPGGPDWRPLPGEPEPPGHPGRPTDPTTPPAGPATPMGGNVVPPEGTTVPPEGTPAPG